MTEPKTSRRDARPASGRMDRAGVTVVAAAVLAVVCCAGGPALIAVLGTVALGSLVGWAAGAAGLVMAVGVLAVLARRRRISSAVASSAQAR